MTNQEIIDELMKEVLRQSKLRDKMEYGSDEDKKGFNFTSGILYSISIIRAKKIK